MATWGYFEIMPIQVYITLVEVMKHSNLKNSNIALRFGAWGLIWLEWSLISRLSFHPAKKWNRSRHVEVVANSISRKKDIRMKKHKNIFSIILAALVLVCYKNIDLKICCGWWLTYSYIGCCLHLIFLTEKTNRKQNEVISELHNVWNI